MRMIPGISKTQSKSNSFQRQLFFLAVCYGGLAIPMFCELVETEFKNSHKITSELTPLILNQNIQYNIYEKKC